MRRFICCVGLPASGKTSWARNRIGCLRVNQDDIRKELGWTSWATWDFKGELERRVHVIKELRLQAALADKTVQTIISDDTNLSRERRERMARMAHEAGVKFEIKRFDTPVEECIERDKLRGAASVGERVIREMAVRYHMGVPKEDPALQDRFLPVENNDELMNAVICDLDGTLSLFEKKGHRGPYDASLCDRDDINPAVLAVLVALHRSKLYQVLYVSGREERFRPQTMQFFKEWLCPPGPLYMRRTGDHRVDWIVKGELFDAHIRNRYNVRLVLDDRQQVVDFWRSIGLECWQVAKGDF